MDSDRAVQFKQMYPHTQFNLCSPVIDVTIPAPGLNLVSTASNASQNLTRDASHLSAQATLQAASSISLNNTAQLVPMTTFDNFQPYQMLQHQTYVNQEDMSKSGNQYLQVQLACGTLPAIAQQSNSPGQISLNNIHMTNNNATQSPSVTSKKLSTLIKCASPEDTTKYNDKHFSATMLSNKRSSYQSIVSKSTTPGDHHNNVVPNKSTIAPNVKQFKCHLCNREFKNHGNLKTHASTHPDQTERPYDCETCGRKFTQKGNRDIHVKIHTGTRDHTCPYCDKGFVQRGNLKTHIRSVHTGEKPYACSHCGKLFSQKANMLTHFRTHDKNSRFPCNSCNKTFSQKGNLKTHQQRHVQHPTSTTVKT